MDIRFAELNNLYLFKYPGLILDELVILNHYLFQTIGVGILL